MASQGSVNTQDESSLLGWEQFVYSISQLLEAYERYFNGYSHGNCCKYVPMECKESNHMIVKHAKHAMIAVCYVLKRAKTELI
jgi:hypothetical protein